MTNKPSPSFTVKRVAILRGERPAGFAECSADSPISSFLRRTPPRAAIARKSGDFLSATMHGGPSMTSYPGKPDRTRPRRGRTRVW